MRLISCQPEVIFHVALISFREGSVIVDMFLYFSLDFEQKLSELKKEFVSGLNKTLQPDVYHLGDYRVDVVTLTITGKV